MGFDPVKIGIKLLKVILTVDARTIVILENATDPGSPVTVISPVASPLSIVSNLILTPSVRSNI